MIDKKEGAKSTKEGAKKYGTLYVFSQIQLGRSVGDIVKDGKLSKRSIMRYIKELRLNGYIKKIGYGVWEAQNKVPKFNPCGLSSNPPLFKSVRSHGFAFYLRIPKLYKWKRRKEYFINKGIEFKEEDLIGINSQQIELKDFHVRLFDNGIQFIWKKGKSIYSNSATLGNEIALRYVLDVIKSLERLLATPLSFGKEYKIKVSRQHHALIKNELASLYNKDGKKLKVFDEKGLWLLIDNSLNLDELETVKGSSASQDMDNVVKPFFNSLKEAPFTAYDFKNLFEATTSLATNTDRYAKNIELHLSTLQEMKEAIKELKEAVKK